MHSAIYNATALNRVAEDSRQDCRNYLHLPDANIMESFSRGFDVFSSIIEAMFWRVRIIMKGE